MNPETETTIYEQTRHYRDIAVLLATASALTGSPSLIDRMANALNSEPAIRSVKDALRVIDSDLSQSDEKRKIKLVKDQEGQKERMQVRIKLEEGDIFIYGHLPNNEVVRRFIEDVSRDPSIARKVGALASAILVEAKLHRGE